MIVIRIFFYLLIALMALLLMIIAIPFGYSIEGSENQIKGVLSWTVFKFTYFKYFHGKEKFSIGILWLEKSIPVERDGRPSKKKVKERSKKKSIGINLARGKTVDLINQVFILIRRIIQSIKPRQLKLDARIGFDDPMNTGIMYAIYWEFHYLLGDLSVDVKPEFGGRMFMGKYSAKGRIWILSILAAFARFLISPPVSSELKKMMRSKLFSKKGVAGNVRF